MLYTHCFPWLNNQRNPQPYHLKALKRLTSTHHPTSHSARSDFAIVSSVLADSATVGSDIGDCAIVDSVLVDFARSDFARSDCAIAGSALVDFATGGFATVDLASAYSVALGQLACCDLMLGGVLSIPIQVLGLTKPFLKLICDSYNPPFYQRQYSEFCAL